MDGVDSEFGAALSMGPQSPGSEARPARRLSTSPPESEARPAKRFCGAEGEFENFDVFISHRGPDTKKGIVGDLYVALRRAGLDPFVDCESIGKGQDCWECIDRAIRTTPVGLVIFSESFAQSQWCMKELHVMLDCPSMKVFPIFYNVQPSELRHLKDGKFATGFKKLAERHPAKLIGEWGADLEKAADLFGWEFAVDGKRWEVHLRNDVVKEILKFSNQLLPLHVDDNVVGVKQVIEDLIKIVDEEKVLRLGLWGMGGIGKTTLALELYNQLRRRFAASCYVSNVTEKVNNPGGVLSVQNQILKDLCGNQSMENSSEESQVKSVL